MKIYFAPLEGITNYVFRNMHHRHYQGVDKYFTPFISPAPSQRMKEKELKDVFPENNEGIPLVPQIMTNRSADFLELARTLQGMGYGEINLNLGCPSGTVVSKKKGSGFLTETGALDRFLDEICEDPLIASGQVRFSVKTRIGRYSAAEWPLLQEIYDRYPLEELIIHPRVQKDMYRNEPNREIYAQAAREMQKRPVYNGDLFTPEDFGNFLGDFPQTEAVMLGRGMIRNPELGEIAARIATDPETFRQAGGDADPYRMDIDRFERYIRELIGTYEEHLFGEKTVLFKMKDIWNLVMDGYPDYPKIAKRIRKCTRLAEYEDIVAEMLQIMREERKA